MQAVQTLAVHARCPLQLVCASSHLCLCLPFLLLPLTEPWPLSAAHHLMQMTLKELVWDFQNIAVTLQPVWIEPGLLPARLPLRLAEALVHDPALTAVHQTCSGLVVLLLLQGGVILLTAHQPHEVSLEITQVLHYCVVRNNRMPSRSLPCAGWL